MGVNISYMGTKRELAPAVAEVIDSAQVGTVLDVFSGMCSVGEAIAPTRQVWTNDIQVFAYEVATALFTSSGLPLRSGVVADLHFDSYIGHLSRLNTDFSRSVAAESRLLDSPTFEIFESRYTEFKRILSEETSLFGKIDYSLFTRIYPDTFFGIGQAIEIDAIVKSIHDLFSDNLITRDQRRWLVIGLGRAMLRSSNSTGHFAQFLKPKAQSYRTFMRQRRRQIWSEWLAALDDMGPIGSSDWRQRNRTFNVDSLALIPFLNTTSDRPSVVYADPPYTDDQYSRFYHLLETLVMYDYPEVTGAGLYRTNRFRTPFSLKSEAVVALQILISAIAESGADIVLSYPTNGLIYKADCDPEKIIRKYFRSVERCFAIAHTHSTFGASKGAVKTEVVEQIFLGRA